MIKFTEDIEDIVLLWQEAFGDCREDIEFFTNNLKNGKCIAIYDNDIKSMLYLVDCKISNESAKYVYAACTLSSQRKYGYMSKLLDYCHSQFGTICLIPANAGLIDYYAARGFKDKAKLTDIAFDEIDEIIEYLFEGCELENPFIMIFKGE